MADDGQDYIHSTSLYLYPAGWSPELHQALWCFHYPKKSLHRDRACNRRGVAWQVRTVEALLQFSLWCCAQCMPMDVDKCHTACRVTERGNYSEPDAARIIRQILDGVSYLHGQGENQVCRPQCLRNLCQRAYICILAYLQYEWLWSLNSRHIGHSVLFTTRAQFEQLPNTIHGKGNE